MCLLLYRVRCSCRCILTHSNAFFRISTKTGSWEKYKKLEKIRGSIAKQSKVISLLQHHDCPLHLKRTPFLYFVFYFILKCCFYICCVISDLQASTPRFVFNLCSFCGPFVFLLCPICGIQLLLFRRYLALGAMGHLQPQAKCWVLYLWKLNLCKPFMAPNQISSNTIALKF